jgi:biotin-(acetyl-CoA carboxylase) ligase
MKEFTNLLLSMIIMGFGVNYIYKNLNMTWVTSTIDNRSYRVRKLDDKQDAADMLAKISNHLTRLVDHTYTTDPSKEGVQQLKDNFNSHNIIENAPGGTYTAYSVNKGEQLALCLRNADNDKFVEMNLVLFVAIHELAHIMTDEVGHTPKFWANMEYLLRKGESIGVYTPEDYSKNPKMYCGLEINSTPYKF